MKRRHRGPLSTTASLIAGTGRGVIADAVAMRLMAGRAAWQPAGDRPSEGQAHGDEGVAEVALRA
jgi:hypothetical protein